MPSCRICDASSDHREIEAREMMFGTRESFAYFECVRCGCVQIRELPDDETLEGFYPSDYYSQRPVAGRTGTAWTRGLRRPWTRLRTRFASLTPRPERARFGGHRWFADTRTDPRDPVLDVGCGAGRLLRRMRRAGFEQLTGVDPHLAESKEIDGGLRLRRESLREHTGRYHLVMAHHSFEHVRDPHAAMADLVRLLEPGGWLLLRVPLADSWAFRHYGSDWVQLDAPRHLHLHTEASLGRLFEDAGLRLHARTRDSRAFQIWGSEQVRMDIALLEPGSYQLDRRRAVFKRRDVRKMAREARRLNARGEGDQAAFYLQKPVT